MKPCPQSQEHSESPSSPEHIESGVTEHTEASAYNGLWHNYCHISLR